MTNKTALVLALMLGLAPAAAQTPGAGVLTGAVAGAAVRPTVVLNPTSTYPYQTLYNQTVFGTPIYGANGAVIGAFGAPPAVGAGVAAPPSRRIVAIATAVEAAVLNNVEAAKAKVNEIVRLGATCADVPQPCTSIFDGIRFDFRRGIYLVSLNGLVLAVERNGVFAEPQPSMVQETFRQEQAILDSRSKRSR